MKKIIIFNASSFIYGAERGLLNLIKVLKDNFEITIVLPCKGPLEKMIKNISSDINIKKFPQSVLMFSLSPFYYIKFVFFLIVNIIYFIFYVAYKNIDIVCTNSLLLISPSIVAVATKRKHIWYVREFFAFDLVNSMLGRFIEKFSDIVICQSETIKNKLFITNKAIVTYEPLDISNYKIYDRQLVRKELNLSIDSVILTIISRLHPLKGQYEFIKQFRDSLAKFKDLLLVIVGDISPPTLRNRLYKGRIEKLIKKNKLKNVLLLGFREDVDKILSLSDMCIFPFIREEPFGITVAEALMFNKITFFSKLGGVKEIYDIFNRGNEFDMAVITKTAANFKHTRDTMPEKLCIPDILSFSIYKDKITPLFASKNDNV